jgi:hypothetical protein
MMKKYIFIYLLVCISHMSCSVDKQLDDSVQLGFSAKAMNIADPDPIIALSRGHFSVLISHPWGKIKSFTVKHNSNFQGFLSETIVSVAVGVTVDANGVFSEPISTAIIKYPINGTAKAGEILEAEFVFTDSDGKSVSVVSRKKVVNFKSFGTQQFLYQTNPLHSFYTGLSYNAASVNKNSTFRDSLDVFWYRENNTQYLASPNSNRTAQEFLIRYASVPFPQALMKQSRFIKLEGITLANVSDETFAGMDFTNATEIIEGVHNSVYGVLLQDGRKAALEFQLYLTTYSRVRSKVQVAPE